MKFKDRAEAANKLAVPLMKYKGFNPLVLGIPRGGVPLAGILAEKLGGELGVHLYEKIRDPHSHLGLLASISESGRVHFFGPKGSDACNTDAFLDQRDEELSKIQRRRMQLGLPRWPKTCRNRIVIVVDDLIADATDVLAAVADLESYGPQKVIVASPVIGTEICDMLRSKVDEIVAIHSPLAPSSPENYYRQYQKVTDGEIHDILHQHRPERPRVRSSQAGELGG